MIGTVSSRGHVVALLVLAGSVASGCGVDLPRDPDGSLDRIRGGTLRVGVSVDPPWTETSVPVTGREAATPTGIEPALVTDFARSLDADVTWTVGGEESLVTDLEEGRLDLVVGGLTEASPWSEHVALTRPYVTVPGPGGRPEPHVMAAPMGENALLVSLETFLLAQEDRELGR
jgi:polar amino acid transport system substrate-binding protein